MKRSIERSEKRSHATDDLERHKLARDTKKGLKEKPRGFCDLEADKQILVAKKYSQSGSAWSC